MEFGHLGGVQRRCPTGIADLCRPDRGRGLGGVSREWVVLMDDPVLHITRTAFEALVEEVPPPRQQYNIQRRGARVRLRTGGRAKLHFWDVTLIDISRSGVLVANIDRVLVGELYWLSFQVEGLRLKVMARAVRSSVSHFVPAVGGEQQITYHTGMEFSALTDETAELISAYIHRLRALELAR